MDALLRSLLSPNNDERKAAEATFIAHLGADANGVVQHLAVDLLTNTDEGPRCLAHVLIAREARAGPLRPAILVEVTRIPP